MGEIDRFGVIGWGVRVALMKGGDKKARSTAPGGVTADLAHCIQNSSVAMPEAGRRRALYRFEVFLTDTTEGANPIVGDLFKRRSRVDSAVRIAYLGIINVVAYGTSVLSHFLLDF